MQPTGASDDSSCCDAAMLQAMLYNGRAVCHMKMGVWDEAERDLLEALSKDAKNADTLANLVTVGLHLGKTTARYAT
jgi:coatomer protein complex subunit epsilon